MTRHCRRLAALVPAILAVAFLCSPAQAWEPTKPIEFVIPAGTGGGADQMARLIAGIVEKHRLSPRPIIVVNKSGGAGAEGFLHVKGKKGDAHTMIITLSNLFTTPLHTGVPFNWKDLTPIARMALDEFILWVNAETPYKTAKEYLAAVKERSGGDRMKMARDRLRPGRPDPHHPARAGARGEVHLRALQGRRRGVREPGRQARGLDGQQSDRVRQPLEGGAGAPAGRLRHRADRGAGVEGHSDRQGSARRATSAT